MNVFQAYLQRQYRKHGAVSPHDRLQVVESLLERARTQGVFPVSETAVGRVDPQHPGVRALLQSSGSEPSSEALQWSRGLGMKIPSGDEMAEWPTWKKLALLGGVVGGILLLTFLMVALRGFFRARAARGVTSPTPVQTATLAESVRVSVPRGVPSPTPTPPPPSPTPTLAQPQGGVPPFLAAPTATPALGMPPDDPAAPVALNIEGYGPIPVYLAELDAQGRWQVPRNGGQWLPESYIRKVFAIGPDLAGTLSFREGARVEIRTRGGFVEHYVLTRRLAVEQAQIEVMQSDRPSIAIVLLRDEGTPEVWLAELPEALAYAHGLAVSAVSTSSASQNAEIKAIVVVDGARLRDAPSTQAKIVRRLPSGTMLELDGTLGGIERGRYVWYRVTAPYPGWVASVVIQMLYP